MVIAALGCRAVKKFITEQKPTPQFEAWIKAQPGVEPHQGQHPQVQLAIAGYVHTDEVRKGILGPIRLPDDGGAPSTPST